MRVFEIVGVIFDAYEKRTGRNAVRHLEGKLKLSQSNIYKWGEHPGGSGSNLPTGYYADVQDLAPELPFLVAHHVKEVFGYGYSISWIGEQEINRLLTFEIQELTGALKELVDVMDTEIPDMDSIGREKIIKARKKIIAVGQMLGQKLENHERL